MTSSPPDLATTALNPVVVTSPVIRSGTTFVQRLLCSSPDTLVYGEMIGQDLETLLQLYTVKTQLYGARTAHSAETLGHVLAGQTDEWILDLMPPVEAYLAAFGRGAFAGLINCRDHATSVGRRVWGFKYPGWQPAMLLMLQRHLPKARFLCVHRDLLACARSAKAQGELRGQQEFSAFCDQWLTNLRFMLSRRSDPQYLVLSYDELISQPQQSVTRIQTFTGSSAIDLKVFEHKINGFPGGSTSSHEALAYTPPATLSCDELDRVHQTQAAFAEPISGAS